MTDNKETLEPSTAPVVDRSAYSELIHIAAELARGDGFLSTCAEDMNPQLKRADILKTAEAQEQRLKDWAYRIRQVADKLSPAAAAPAAPTEDAQLERWANFMAKAISKAEPVDAERSGFTISRESFDVLVGTHREIAKHLWGELPAPTPPQPAREAAREWLTLTGVNLTDTEMEKGVSRLAGIILRHCSAED